MGETEKDHGIPIWRIRVARYIVIWTVPVVLLALAGFFAFVLFMRGSIPRTGRVHVSNVQFTMFFVETLALTLAWLPFPMNIWAIGMLRTFETRRSRILRRLSYVYVGLYGTYLLLWVLSIIDFFGFTR